MQDGLNLDYDSLLVLAFHHDGIRDLVDLVSLPPEVIDQLEYIPRLGYPCMLINYGSTNLVKWFHQVSVLPHGMQWMSSLEP